MEKVRSVCIIERLDQKVAAVYLKEFFMFAGVYVYESIADASEILKIKERKKHEVNLYIDLTGNENDSERLDDSTVYIKLAYSEDEQYKQLNIPKMRRDFGNKIFELIWKKLEIFMHDKTDIQGFKSLSRIFVKNDYAHEHYLSHLYLNQMSNEKKNALSKFYLNCFKDIYKELRDNDSSLNLTFAYLNCARKMNRIDMSCNRQTLFDETKVMKMAHKLTERDSSFTIADVLAGQIAFSRSSIWTEGLNYLSEALQQEKRKQYSSFIYYCIGHFYEVEQSDLDKAEEFYSYINEFNPENYRMNFKLGWIRYFRSKYNEAWNYFYKVYKQMSEKKDTGWIQPLEMEYLYKCELILSRSESLKNTHIGQNVLENDISYMKNTVFNNSSFISAFLSENEREIYSECFIRKMEDHNYSLIID